MIPIGTLGTIPSLTDGGVVYPDLSSSLITLHAFVTGANNTTFRKPGAGAGYQVTSGKTLTIRSIKIDFLLVSNGCGFTLAQSDNDVGLSIGTAPTNPVYFTATSTDLPLGYGFTVGQSIERPIFFPVAATKYFTLVGTSGFTKTYLVTAFGYEA